MIRALVAGDSALLLEADVPAAWLAAAITRASLPGVIDVVPGARTVLVVTSPGALDAGSLSAAIATLPVVAPEPSATPVTEIAVTYDGPDLADVAEIAGLSVHEVVAAHQGAVYTVGWLGFSPGFGYLTGLDPRLRAVPRLATPRISVPAGSVAIAGGLAAVYPSASPGGWRLLGRTSARMWDPSRVPPALLRPGQLVRFRAAPDAGTPASAPMTAAGKAAGSRPQPPAGASYLEVIRPGPLATVQDRGRPGLGAFGVPPSGAADAASLVAANRLIGNPDAAAGIELTLGRAVLRCVGGARLVVAGAPAPVVCAAGPGHQSEQVPMGTPFWAPDGSLIKVGPPTSGLRSYLAVAGGVQVPAVLGSRAADLLSGLGGGPLRPGDLLPIGAATGDQPVLGGVPATVTPHRGATARLRIIAGPRLDWFSAGSLATLCGSPYTVSAVSNRTGLRLDGATLARSGSAELPSEGMVTGSLEVPHDGKPILLLADHPTVGGYPVIAVLVAADLGLAAQLRPGDEVRFVAEADQARAGTA